MTGELQTLSKHVATDDSAELVKHCSMIVGIAALSDTKYSCLAARSIKTFPEAVCRLTVASVMCSVQRFHITA